MGNKRSKYRNLHIYQIIDDMQLTLKSVLLFWGVSLFCSCQIQQNVFGKYTVIQRGKYPEIIPVTLCIELNSDSTFSYNYRNGFRGENSAGFWRKDEDNKRVIINSSIQDIQNIPIVVTEMKSNNNSLPVFVFDNPLKLDTSVKWVLNVNDTDYPLNTDSLVLEKEIVVENFHLTGYIALEDSTYGIVPFPLQNTIQSERYKVKNKCNNLYHISFSQLFDNNIFHYKPLQDSLKLNGNTLFFKGIKLKKK